MRASKATPFARRFHLFASVIDRVFDRDTTLQGAIGPAWVGLASVDREALRSEFRHFTIASWVANFDNFAGEVFRVKPDIRSLSAAGQVVGTEFFVPGSDLVKLSYVLRARRRLAGGGCAGGRTISHVAAQLCQKNAGLLAG
ncbi:MAG: hypothetical protein EXR09_00405 [Acetobacteraceae bacterium]|nr:hypothetical protein [Acetobacteraceae bacterium]